MTLDIHPLTPAHWPDLETLFAGRGCAEARACWCMYYRRSTRGDASGSRAALRAMAPEARAACNRADLQGLCERASPAPGVLAYRAGEPVGWLSLGPREDFAYLRTSRSMKAVDAQPVWSVICFVVPSAYRGQGVTTALLQGGIAYARQQRVQVLEAYPVDLADRSRDAPGWFGFKLVFDRAGFVEVARHTSTRPVMRLALQS